MTHSNEELFECTELAGIVWQTSQEQSVVQSLSRQCPYCGHFTAHRGTNVHFDNVSCFESRHGTTRLIITQHLCSNPACQELSLSADWWTADNTVNPEKLTAVLGHWSLRPSSRARPQPEYIPLALRQDYEEACKIAALSPKAAATLARRCLQGMIRDFHGIEKRRLVDAIEALHGVVAPEVWAAIDAVRKIGNIGAHMESDINLVIDVDEDEANLLIELVEQLFAEWYVSRHQRAQRMKAITEAAAVKETARQGQQPQAPSQPPAGTKSTGSPSEV
ncbi:hypothetical protein FRZ44_21320 [Hypericibacter terrae]|uniref:DUF4145 domain-containing protein n=1 Tax=Hypericibacter terrae TaxID=2602015 RepID=A0A5J6MI53_9PROT|nr:DUF4145 domain-containing protein [Hypericibacter terrae]QEX16837.1 hypothetical protein FRZ44_21320 [Hypericibacter terrae]